MGTKTLTTASLAHRCIVTRGDHGGVGWVTCPRHPGAVLHRGLDLALSGQAPSLDDGLLDGLRPDPARLPHQGDLRRGLDHPHVM